MESHIPRLWAFEEIWEYFSQLMEHDGNNHIFPTLGSGEMFSVNQYNYQNMGKVNSHSKEKIWENKNII